MSQLIAPEKYVRFEDIPQLTKSSNYRVNVDWKYLEDHLNSWSVNRLCGASVDLDPDFQRAHVWNETKQIRYVEYILRGGKSSRDLYFNCIGWDKDYRGPFVLVDGKQRLEAVRKFLRNELKVFGSYYNEYTDSIRRVHPDFIVHVNNLKSTKEVLQWYLDLNEGGVVHTTEELDKVKEMLRNINEPNH